MIAMTSSCLMSKSKISSASLRAAGRDIKNKTTIAIAIPIRISVHLKIGGCFFFGVS